MNVFKGRINRTNFIYGLIIFAVLKFIAALPTYIILYSQKLDAFTTLSEFEAAKLLASYFSITTWTGILFHVLMLAVIVWSLGVYVRRLHDIGKSGALSGLVILNFLITRGFAEWVVISGFNGPTSLWILQIPHLVSALAGIFIIYLLIKKGENKENQYGKIPEDKMGVKEILLAK